MYQIDFNKPQHIYFMGIGGISMSGLAEILMDEGFTISGSDSKESELTEHLRSRGAFVSIGQRAENIAAADEAGGAVDAVVYTAAIHLTTRNSSSSAGGHSHDVQSGSPGRDDA